MRRHPMIRSTLYERIWGSHMPAIQSDAYWVPECVRAYLRSARYSTRALEDIEPHVREWNSWMRAIGEFCNRGAAPALRSLARGKAFRLAPLVLAGLVPGHELLRPGQRKVLKRSDATSSDNGARTSIGVMLPNETSVSIIFVNSIARDTTAEKWLHMEETAAGLITYWPRPLVQSG